MSFNPPTPTPTSCLAPYCYKSGLELCSYYWNIERICCFEFLSIVVSTLVYQIRGRRDSNRPLFLQSFEEVSKSRFCIRKIYVLVEYPTYIYMYCVRLVDFVHSAFVFPRQSLKIRLKSNAIIRKQVKVSIKFYPF